MVKAGDASVEVHGDADPDRVAREIEAGFDRGAEIAEAELKETGKEIGDILAKSAAKEIEKSGPELAEAVEKGIRRRKIRAKVDVDVDRDRSLGEKIVAGVTEDIESAFSKVNRPGGPINRIGAALADAIGASFNISGRSPLIAFLVPLVGAIIGLVVGAVQAVNGLIAILATLPALIAGIGIQVGALAFAFQGVGEAVKGAFDAKNAKELNEAIKNLTPSAQRFVRELLPLRDLFKFITKQSQEAFFANLGSIIPQLQMALGRALGEGFPRLAAALGQLFRDIALFFASPTFVTFVNKLFPATIEFLKFFGPNFIKFLDGLVQMSTTILPFLNMLGRMLGGTLFQLGDFLQRIVRNGSLEKWLDSMGNTVQLLLELFGTLVEFVTVFLAQLDAAGGAAVLQAIIDAFSMMSFFLSTDVGKKALEGLINFSIIAIKVTTGLILAIFLILAAFQSLAEWIVGTAIPSIGEFLNWLGSKILWLFETVGGALLWFFNIVGGAIITAFEAVKRFISNLADGMAAAVVNLVATAKGIPGKVTAALGNILGHLYDAGRNLIQGFINGMLSKADAIAQAARSLLNRVMSFFPGSPAEEGPLSGQGYSLYRGQRMIQDFAKGIRMEIPEIRNASSEATSNITFGRDAIRVTFEGALPTQDQAMQTGSAVGAGINGRLAARNTRLAIRTL